MEIQTIDIKDVIDFCWCPKYYDLKHDNPSKKNLKQLYDEALHRCFYSYLLALQNDTLENSIGALKYRWGQEWVQQKTNSKIICTPSASKRDTYDSKRRAGVEAIITFDELMNTPQYPIVINKQFSVKITDKITLTGNWEYIREITQNENKVFQILKFKVENNRFQMVSQMAHDLELTAAALAFKQMFNQDAQLIYVDIYKHKMVPSIRTEKDFKLLRDTVISVVKCINHNIRCISPDKRCYHCEYRDLCVSTL